MALVKTIATVLHTIPYKETSLIARVLSPEYGVVSVVAKGAKRKNNVTGIHFSFLNTLALEIYYSPSRDLHTLKESEVVENREQLSQHMIPHAVAQVMAEIIIQTSHDSLGAKDLFSLLNKGFQYLNEQSEYTKDMSALFLSRYLIQVARVLGFELNFEHCYECMHLIDLTPALFSIERGGCLCRDCCSHATIQNTHFAQTLLFLGKRLEIPSELLSHVIPIEEMLIKYITLHSGMNIRLKSYDYLKTVRSF